MNLNHLLTVKGLLNAAITKQKKFKQSEEYQYILNNSHELDIFKNVNLSERFWFVYDKMKIDKCIICGKPRICFKHSEKTLRLCKHKQHMENYKGCHKKYATNLKIKFEKLLNENPQLLLSDEQFNNYLLEKTSKTGFALNASFILSDKFLYFYHDIIIKTNHLIPYKSNDYKLNERFYLLINNLTAIPICKFCGKLSYFKNNIVGYSKSCKDCYSILIGEIWTQRNFEFIQNNFNFNKYEIISIPKIMNREPLIIKCKKCGKISEWYLINGLRKNLKNLRLCKYCEHTSSQKENNVFEFIKEIYNDIIIHKKDGRKIIPPLELDIYIPKKNLAIEFDGLYWHSFENGTPIDYHLIKTNKCIEKDIQLIHIFESEWDYKKDIVKSRIKNLLGIYDHKCYARQCKIKEIDSKTSRQFQEKNHIQGSANSKINIGLFYKDELVSLMTFSKPRFDKKYEWELVRFCNKLGWHIPGAASKLLTTFERKYKPITLLSYADRRWSTGNLYKMLGFKLDHISKPNYWYIDRSFNIYSRILFQKHKLSMLLKNFDSNKTEYENMRDNGYLKIYDCGNLVFVKKYE